MMILGVFSVVDDILNFIRDILQGWVLSNLEDMFNILNEKTAGIVTELTTSPDDWQGGTIWTLIEKIAENVALPIAGTFLTLVIIWDLLNLLTAGNNFGDVDILSVIIKWLLKSMVAAWFIANSLKICTCFLEIGVWMVKKTKNVFSSQVASVASGDQSDQLMLFFNTYFTADEDATSSLIGQLLGLGILTMIMCLVMKVMGVLITIVLYSRMISIYMHCSMCPIPAAMLLNPHLNQIGYEEGNDISDTVSSKQFYTITTSNGQTFYLIIDLTSSQSDGYDGDLAEAEGDVEDDGTVNSYEEEAAAADTSEGKVYFLSYISNDDLLNVTGNTYSFFGQNSLATDSNIDDSLVTSEEEATEEDTSETTETTEEEVSEESSSGNLGTIIVVVIFILVAFAVIFYMQKNKGKSKTPELEDDFLEEDYGDDANADNADVYDDDDIE